MVTSSMSYFLLFFGYLTSNFISSEETSLTGRRTPCHNEGEEVQLDQKYFQPCFKCICQNGFVECETESCPAVDDCYALVKKPAGECCDKCKDCLFNGQVYESGTEWTGGPEDPCTHYKCVAGVVTESQMKCYTPCSNPSPPRPGQCCPTCLGCHLNGQNLMEDGNVREVTLTEDPCVKCHCSGKRLTCTKKACPVLQCPPSLQFLPEGQCCKKCAKNIDYIKPSKGGCILNGQYYASSMSKEMWVDRCSTCSCFNESSMCRRNTCPVLECSQEYQETKPGECCPYCVLPAEVKTVCVYGDVTYQNNQTWNMSPCRSCSCQNGEIRCAQTQCPEIRCRPNEKAVVPDGECCSRCVEIPSVCTVFGDPHYKTFDGKFFSFQGSCKYQLTADCVDHTFSIRVTNDARSTKFSSWTKTVTLKMMNVKINLGQKLRVKVNGTRVLLPYKLHNVVHIMKGQDDEINVETALGIKLIWDGYSFLQVEAPVTYKNKLCGLCGNYNNIYRDDLTTRHGHNLTDNEVRKFAESWRVGGLRACARKPNENPHKPQHCASKRQRAGYCKYLKTEDIFENCNLRINYDKYFEFCKMDMCECPSQKCYCESFTAYAHECQRHGISLENWRENSGCKLNTLHNRKNEISHRPKHEKQNHGKRNHFRWKTPTPPSLLNKQHIPKTVIHAYSGRTPPPLF